MRVLCLSTSARAAELRLTEDPTLYGMVTREQGQLVEYVSYEEALRRQDDSVSAPQQKSDDEAGEFAA